MTTRSPIAECADYFGVPVAAIVSGGNAPKVARARAHLAAYLSDCGVTRLDIGLILGRNHKAVDRLIADGREAEAKQSAESVSDPTAKKPFSYVARQSSKVYA